jgi:hypothetical protein
MTNELRRRIERAADQVIDAEIELEDVKRGALCAGDDALLRKLTIAGERIHEARMWLRDAQSDD